MLGLCPVSKAWADADLSDNQVVMQTQKKVKGQVIDATGEPLIGVNISVIVELKARLLILTGITRSVCRQVQN